MRIFFFFLRKESILLERGGKTALPGFFDSFRLLCSRNMKNGFSSGRGFQFSPSASSEISPPRDSAAFSNAPPTIHRPTATPLRLDSPLARVQTKRRCAYALHSPFPLDFSTRFLLRFPLETRSLPATCNLCKSFFLTIRISLSSLFISLIFIFNRHPRWPLHSYRSIFLVPSYGWSVLTIVPLVERSLAGRWREKILS